MLTLFSESTEQRAAEAADKRASHFARLAARLGDGSLWDYTGDCGEDSSCQGVCACGHQGLRFLFTIRHRVSNDTAIVGSTCIEHYSEVNPAMVAGIVAARDELEQAARARLAAAKRLAAESAIQSKLAEWSALLWELDAVLAGEYRAGGWRRTSPMVYNLAGGVRSAHLRLEARTPEKPHPLARMKQYKQLSAAARYIDERLAQARYMLANPWE